MGKTIERVDWVSAVGKSWREGFDTGWFLGLEAVVKIIESMPLCESNEEQLAQRAYLASKIQSIHNEFKCQG
jgi:hypothetical protein